MNSDAFFLSQNWLVIFVEIFHHIIEDNNCYQMILVIRLATPVNASGNHMNFNIAKQSDTVISKNNHKIRL